MFYECHFPEVYTGGKAPAAFGTRDLERSVTPVYRYGWVVSRAELFEALNGEPCRYDRHLYRIYVGASRRFYGWWTEKGYDNNEYRWAPIVSSVFPHSFSSKAPTFHLSRSLALNTSSSTWHVTIPTL